MVGLRIQITLKTLSLGTSPLNGHLVKMEPISSTFLKRVYEQLFFFFTFSHTISLTALEGQLKLIKYFFNIYMLHRVLTVHDQSSYFTGLYDIFFITYKTVLTLAS